MNRYIQNGEGFLDRCLFDGLAHSYDVIAKEYVKPYPEVTGYVLSYFCNNGLITPKLLEAGERLIQLQNNEKGGWASFYDFKYLFAFDTAQILIGLCNLYQKTEQKKYLDAALSGGDFLRLMQQENGAILPIYDTEQKKCVVNLKTYAIWNGPYSGLMCKLTEAFQKLYDVTGERKYLAAKEKTANFYSAADYIEHTHPMGYWLEGLYAAERYEAVKKIVEEKVIPRIRENGYIAYTEGVSYAYVSGVIQLGIILFKLGYRGEAELIRSYGRVVQQQHTSGGLFQYADCEGKLDCHIHTEINSWGTKYFCELERLLEEK